MSDDATLVRAWQQGDETAGSTVVRALFPRVVRFFRHKVPDDEVQDLTQQTFIELTRSLPKVDPERDLAPWLFTIARRQLLHRHRYRLRHPVDPLSFSTEAAQVTPSKVVHSQEIREVLRSALAGLPLDHQLALELRYWERLPIEAIAEVLEIGAGATKMRLLRARRELRRRLEEQGLSAALAATTLAGFTGVTDDD